MEKNLDNLHARAAERRQQRHHLQAVASASTRAHERRQLLEWFAGLPTHSLREFKVAIIAARKQRQQRNAKAARIALARKRLEAKKNKNTP